ncbi:MAG: type-F conjugative transfer system secretin TraK, partial [Succinivibrio sp.]
MKTKLTAISVCLYLTGLAVSMNAQANIFSGAHAAEVLSQPQVKSVFKSSPSSASTQQNLEAVQNNTPNSGGVFNRKYGTTSPIITTPNGMSRQEENEETPYEETSLNSSVQTTSSSKGSFNPDDALKAQLEATQAELKRTREKLAETTAMYGDLPADAEKLKSQIPSVPKSVLTNLPKTGDATTTVSGSTDLRVKPGVNQIITISTDQPNRIITPFNNPQILSSALQGGSGKECGEVCVKGNVVYVSTKKDYPLGLFITDKGNEQTAISLTLVPRRIPPREVNLILNDSNTVTLSGSEEANVWETSQPFVNTLKKTLLAIALGEVPSGYHLQKIPSKYQLPVCNQSGLKFDFSKGQLMAGVNLNYVIGTVTNVSNQPIEIIEAS